MLRDILAIIIFIFFLCVKKICFYLMLVPWEFPDVHRRLPKLEVRLLLLPSATKSVSTLSAIYPWTSGVIIKLGRIWSNSFEFRNFELQNSNSIVEFGRIWLSCTNLIKFDLTVAKFDQIRSFWGLFWVKKGTFSGQKMPFWSNRDILKDFLFSNLHFLAF